MAMKKKPVTGMKDILPKEMAIRDYAIGLIKETYRSFGFTSMETPAVEHIENLTSNQGGENEKLIFKILKRGEKLDAAVESLTPETAGNLTDSGLRYDLTLPLSRYYANNEANLPSPFKALQMGPVWRADRPQRGRYRQFMQCDIDILGEPDILAETELVLATTTLLGRLNFKNFTIRINDRRILKAMAAWSGFKEEDYESVFITLDKMDKIGLSGVKEELIGMGYSEETVSRYLGLFPQSEEAEDGVDSAANSTDAPEQLKKLQTTLGEYLPEEISNNLATIIAGVEGAKAADFRMKFDPTLVRGMSYYTGPIFEISMDEYGGSVGGGGRYDEMIGKFTGQATPAVGFSIGFERIIMLLLENGFEVPGAAAKKAYLIEKNMPADKLQKILAKARTEREAGTIVNISVMKKNKKFQKEKLAEEGYTDITEFFKDREID